MTIRVGLAWDAAGPVDAGRGMLDLAREAGMDTFLVFDHLISGFPAHAWNAEFTHLAESMATPDACLDFATVLGNFATRAGPVRLAVGVTDPHRRHPAVLAQTALTLAHLCERPPILGIGAGAVENLRPFGIAHDRVIERVEESLRLLRLLIDQPGPHSFQGRHFTLDAAPFGLRAVTERLPEIWVGANGPRMLELAGRYGDGWLPSDLVSPAEYRARLVRVHAAAERAGRDPDRITASGGIPIVVAETAEAARELLRNKAIRFLALQANSAAWRAHGAAHPYGPNYRGLHEMLPHTLSAAEVERGLAAVPDAVLEAQVIAGTPERVLDRIGALIEAGLRHPILIPASALASAADAAFTVEAMARITDELNRYAPAEAVVS